MKCYNCGSVLDKENICVGCGVNVKIYKKIIMASNTHYNEALKKAQVRDLSGAAASLKLSLRFYKMNTDARNLLGLVYFEMGETVAALSEWVISKNYQPRENLASRYLDELQNNPSRLESINQTIKKYNQSLQYCRQDSRDLAVIQLKKVLSMNPKLVSAYQLLALLYLEERKYDAAQKALHSAAKIDVNNMLTLRYLRETKEALKQNDTGRKSRKETQISYRSGNETIIQPRYVKDTSVAHTMLNMVIGVVIGAAITAFLIVPGVRREMLNSAKSQVLEANNTIASRNQTISTLEQQVEQLTAEVSRAQESAVDWESRISSYEQLLQAYQKYTEEDIEASGLAMANVNAEYLSEAAKAVYESINAEINAEYVRAMYEEGTAAYNSQDYETAVADFEKVIAIEETYDNGNVLYYIAQCYRKLEDWENARIYYQKVVELYPGSERANIAQNYLASSEMQQ